MSGSIAIVGAGQIGFAVAEDFARDGWRVRVLSRTEPPWLAHLHEQDREAIEFEPFKVGQPNTPRADVVVDTIAYDEEDVVRYDPAFVGRLILISSASVYRDSQGRSLDSAAVAGFPDFSDPVTEEQATVDPGPETYSTRKVRMENKAFDLFGEQATVIRPCAIYGPWSKHPREYWFVNRLKARRRIIPLAFDGNSQFHPTNVRMIGDFARLATYEDLGGIFNLADGQAPKVREIGKRIADQFGRRVRLYGLDGPPEGTVGRTPWSVPNPFLISSAKAIHAGLHWGDYEHYDPAEAIDWLRGQRFDNWQTAFPQLAGYPWDLFDFEAEDRFLDERL
ncbi:MAG: reductase [Pseudomonadota bacterium]